PADPPRAGGPTDRDGPTAPPRRRPPAPEPSPPLDSPDLLRDIDPRLEANDSGISHPVPAGRDPRRRRKPTGGPNVHPSPQARDLSHKRGESSGRRAGRRALRPGPAAPRRPPPNRRRSGGKVAAVPIFTPFNERT